MLANTQSDASREHTLDDVIDNDCVNTVTSDGTIQRAVACVRVFKHYCKDRNEVSYVRDLTTIKYRLRNTGAQHKRSVSSS